jgi:predicted nuclease of predicted toxin-antitoxin system
VTAARFVLDEHIHRQVQAQLRRRGIEARTVHELGRRGASDEEHVRWAAREGWVVVTGDKDFLRIARTEPHAGILFIARGRANIGFLVRTLTAAFEAETMESLAGHVKYLREPAS